MSEEKRREDNQLRIEERVEKRISAMSRADMIREQMRKQRIDSR